MRIIVNKKYEFLILVLGATAIGIYLPLPLIIYLLLFMKNGIVLLCIFKNTVATKTYIHGSAVAQW